jgi:hypothetical protein
MPNYVRGCTLVAIWPRTAAYWLHRCQKVVASHVAPAIIGKAENAAKWAVFVRNMDLLIAATFQTKNAKK